MGNVELRRIPRWTLPPELVMAFLERYRNAMRHEHGWEVDLACPDCGHAGLPRYDGWEPTSAITFGSTPTLFAHVACVNCGRDLRSVAGERLRAMFTEITVPKVNRRMVVWFLVAVILIVSLPMVGYVCEVIRAAYGID